MQQRSYLQYRSHRGFGTGIKSDSDTAERTVGAWSGGVSTEAVAASNVETSRIGSTATIDQRIAGASRSGLQEVCT